MSAADDILIQNGRGFNTASGMARLQHDNGLFVTHAGFGFNTASGMARLQRYARDEVTFVVFTFQYRKRYGSVATLARTMISHSDEGVSIPQAVWLGCNVNASMPGKDIVQSFNTASGMARLQPTKKVAAPTDNKGFQYRKRYGSVATNHVRLLQSRKEKVSIPQAVWLGCNL